MIYLLKRYIFSLPTQVDKWLLELEEQMRCSLRKETGRALQNYSMEK